jgi:hypothetical protein
MTTFVFDGDLWLRRYIHATSAEFHQKGILIDLLEKAMTKLVVNFKRRADYLLGDTLVGVILL